MASEEDLRAHGIDLDEILGEFKPFYEGGPFTSFQHITRGLLNTVNAQIQLGELGDEIDEEIITGVKDALVKYVELVTEFKDYRGKQFQEVPVGSPEGLGDDSDIAYINRMYAQLKGDVSLTAVVASHKFASRHFFPYKLKDLGYSVVTADSMDSLLEIMENSQFNLYMMDLNLGSPGSSDITPAVEVFSQMPEGAKFIGFSNSDEAVNKARGEKIVAYLTSQLSDCIEVYLKD